MELSEMSVKDPHPLPLATVEERHIRNVLRHFNGNKTLASRALGIDRRTMYRKLARVGAEAAAPRARRSA